MRDRKIWVTSDTHFNHSNIIKYCARPFNSSEEMDEKLIENWNSVVEDQDIVYHLGDVYMGNHDTGHTSPNKGGYIESVLGRLKGRKRLILGNHDNGKDQILQRNFQKISMWRMFPEFGILLTHVPVHIASLKERLRDSSKRQINVHGHTHTNAEPNNDRVNYKCVCTELTNYTPVDIETLRVT